MASKSKRARLAPQRDFRKTFLYLSVMVFLIKVIISINIPTSTIEINNRDFLFKGIWLGSDGESYLTGFDSLSRDGIFSAASILSYFPAGYPVLILFLSLLGKSWVLITLAVVQSLVFSLAVYSFASQLYRTRLKNYAYLVLVLVLFNPTVSLYTLIIGYESLTVSGYLFAIALIIKDLVDNNHKSFMTCLIVNSIIFGLLVFVQPRLIFSVILINLVWLVIRKGIKLGALLNLVTLSIIMIFPATLVYRNNVASNLNTVSTNLGITMNIGAGDSATGGYMLDGYGVPCRVFGSAVQRDNQRVKCVLSWYFDNPLKSIELFSKKTLYFWSPWINTGFLGEQTITGTNSRNPWLKISPFASMRADPQGNALVNGVVGKFFSWIWELGGIALLIYGFLVVWRFGSVEKLIGIFALIIISSNWLVSLISIGDHRFRIPIMGMSLFLQAVGVKNMFKRGKPHVVHR